MSIDIEIKISDLKTCECLPLQSKPENNTYG